MFNYWKLGVSLLLFINISAMEGAHPYSVVESEAASFKDMMGKEATNTVVLIAGGCVAAQIYHSCLIIPVARAVEFVLFAVGKAPLEVDDAQKLQWPLRIAGGYFWYRWCQQDDQRKVQEAVDKVDQYAKDFCAKFGRDYSGVPGDYSQHEYSLRIHKACAQLLIDKESEAPLLRVAQHDEYRGVVYKKIQIDKQEEVAKELKRLKLK